jgi:hypothetical protein
VRCGERVEIRFGQGLAVRTRHGQQTHVGDLVADRLHALPDLITGRRAETDDHLGPRRAHELDQLRRLEHPVDAAGRRTGQRAEESRVELRHGRQQQQHDVTGLQAARMEQVGDPRPPAL